MTDTTLTPAAVVARLSREFGPRRSDRGQVWHQWRLDRRGDAAVQVSLVLRAGDDSPIEAWILELSRPGREPDPHRVIVSPADLDDLVAEVRQRMHERTARPVCSMV